MKRAALPFAAVLALAATTPQSVLAQRHDDIVDVARNAGQFNTLLAALDAAGLTQT